MEITSSSEQLGQPEQSRSNLKLSRNQERFELLIFSEAGKPIYSYTKREDAVTIMPLCSALINYAKKAQKETLHSIRTSDNLIIHFKTRSPLIIVVINETNSFVDPLMLVEQVEAQLISILTAKTLNSVFEDRPTYDLKRSLYGSEKLIDATTNLCAFPKKLYRPWIEAFLAVTNNVKLSNASANTNPKLPQAFQSPALPARPHRILVPIVIMPSNARDNLHSILLNVISSKSKNMVFSLLFRVESESSNNDDESLMSSSSTMVTTETNISRAGDTDDEEKEINLDSVITFKLITVCNHHDRYKIKVSDIHIILALLSGSRAQLASAESLWLPICLPKFNQDAFVHSYISYMNDNKYCIVMMSIDRDEFANCQESKDMIEEKIGTLLKDPNQKSKVYYKPSPLVHPALLDLQDKLVSQTLTSEEIAEVKQQTQYFNTKQELYQARQIQFLWYQTSKHVLWWQRSDKKSINPVIYYITKKMLQSSLKHLWLRLDDTTLLGWHLPAFQLYAQFDGTISTNEATEVIQRITTWVKKEEENFSIKDYK